MGVRLSLDDFGTGYSSLSYLQRLPFDMLKIDRAFVDGMADSPENQKIVKAISDLARTLDMELIAEGIERDAELPYLTNVGVDFVQGFYFSKPMPEKDVEGFLRKAMTNA